MNKNVYVSNIYTFGCPCSGEKVVLNQFYTAFSGFFSSIVAKRAKHNVHLTHFLGKDACKVMNVFF